MAVTKKVLGQSALAATTLTDVYTVPAATSSVVSTVTFANRAASSTTFRMSVAVAGAADTNKQYVYYDCKLGANSTFAITLGITLAATDVLRAYTAGASVSVNVFGQEST